MSATGHHAMLLSPDSSRSEFLAAVPIFAELSEELRDEVAGFVAHAACSMVTWFG